MSFSQEHTRQPGFLRRRHAVYGFHAVGPRLSANTIQVSEHRGITNAAVFPQEPFPERHVPQSPALATKNPEALVNDDVLRTPREHGRKCARTDEE